MMIQIAKAIFLIMSGYTAAAFIVVVMSVSTGQTEMDSADEKLIVWIGTLAASGLIWWGFA